MTPLFASVGFPNMVGPVLWLTVGVDYVQRRMAACRVTPKA